MKASELAELWNLFVNNLVAAQTAWGKFCAGCIEVHKDDIENQEPMLSRMVSMFGKGYNTEEFFVPRNFAQMMPMFVNYCRQQGGFEVTLLTVIKEKEKEKETKDERSSERSESV